MVSAVFILPAALREAGNTFGRQMQWGEAVYVVPLSPTGQPPATHFACRADLDATPDGDRPPGAPPGFLDVLANPPPAAAPLLSALVFDQSDTLWGRAHFDAVLARLGLVQIRADG